MERRIENKDKILLENAYFQKDGFLVCGFYGLTDFEIYGGGEEFMYVPSQEKFFALYDLMTEMKKEIDRLKNL